MLLIETFKTALDQLFANRMRSILTTLGIIIGIGTVILIVSVLEGFRSSMTQELNILGANTFQIQKYGPRLNVGGPGRLKPRRDLTLDMVRHLRKHMDLAKFVGAEIWQLGQTVYYKGEHTNPNVHIVGTTPEYPMTNGVFIQDGRFFTEHELRGHAKVAIVGTDVVKKLFPKTDPLGKFIRISGQKFKIIGVFEEQGTATFGQSRDNRVAIPITTWQDLWGKSQSINITIMAKNEEVFQEAIDEAIGIMRQIRKIPPGKENDFDIFYNESLVESFNNVARYIQLGGILIGLVSLVVGGIGVMNIMLVSVTERTREIGTRKAVGARNVHILTQFLIEAIILCILGGVIGFGAGIGIAGLISLLAHLPMTIPTWSVVASLITTTLVGVFAGLYPAYKASRLNVVDALRYE